MQKQERQMQTDIKRRGKRQQRWRETQRAQSTALAAAANKQNSRQSNHGCSSTFKNAAATSASINSSITGGSFAASAAGALPHQHSR